VPQNTTLSANIDLATAKVKSNVTSLMGLAIAVILFLLAGLAAAGRLIELRVLAAIVVSFVNNLMLGFGALMTAVAIYLFAVSGAVVAGMTSVMGYLLGTSLLFIAVAVCGHCAVRHKSFPLLMCYIFFATALLVASIGGVWLTFYNAQSLAAWIAGMSDSQLGSIASAMGLSGNKASILSGLQTNLQMIGLACGVAIILQVLSLVSAAYFGCAARAWRLEHGVLSSKEPRHSQRRVGSAV